MDHLVRGSLQLGSPVVSTSPGDMSWPWSLCFHYLIFQFHTSSLLFMRTWILALMPPSPPINGNHDEASHIPKEFLLIPMAYFYQLRASWSQFQQCILLISWLHRTIGELLCLWPKVGCLLVRVLLHQLMNLARQVYLAHYHQTNLQLVVFSTTI